MSKGIFRAIILVFFMFLAVPASAGHPWTHGAVLRALARWEMYKQVGYEYGVDPVLLLAQSIWETGVQDVQGRYVTGVYGVGQVSWYWHRRYLKTLGIAYSPKELLKPRVGLEAQAAVMTKLIGLADGHVNRALCAYAVGSAPLKGKWEDCYYSRNVREYYLKLVKVLLMHHKIFLYDPVQMKLRVNGVEGTGRLP